MTKNMLEEIRWKFKRVQMQAHFLVEDVLNDRACHEEQLGANSKLTNLL